MLLGKAVPMALLSETAVSGTAVKDPVFSKLCWKLQQMTEEIEFMGRIFKKHFAWALGWFPVIASWASWLGITMVYNKMSNPLRKFSWGNNSSHHFAQTGNCWESGLKFYLKRRKLRMFVSGVNCFSIFS